MKTINQMTEAELRAEIKKLVTGSFSTRVHTWKKGIFITSQPSSMFGLSIIYAEGKTKQESLANFLKNAIEAKEQEEERKIQRMQIAVINHKERLEIDIDKMIEGTLFSSSTDYTYYVFVMHFGRFNRDYSRNSYEELMKEIDENIDFIFRDIEIYAPQFTGKSPKEIFEELKKQGFIKIRKVQETTTLTDI